ncbi:MAG TPA: DUF4124 domain-containing protein [Methylophilaceae bacterium]
MQRVLPTFASLLLAVLPASADQAPSHTIFSPDSFWYQPIPADAPLHPDSANFVREFLRQKERYYGNVTINFTSYTSPVYYPSAETKTVTVTQWDCQHKGHLDKALAEQWAAVPVPDYAKQAEGSDAEMSIYQAATDTLWDFWKVRQVDGQWQACWGGRISNASKSDGIFTSYYGTTATSLPFIGGQITAEELAQGEIRHVMGISLVDQEDYKHFSWPAHRSDGNNPKHEPDRIPEGLRFRLDPTVNIDTLDMSPVGKIIAKAAQKYGFVVWDKAGALSLRAQNTFSYTAQGQPDPYQKLLNGTKPYAVLKGFPWDKLQFLPVDYGKPAPNLSRSQP